MRRSRAQIEKNWALRNRSLQGYACCAWLPKIFLESWFTTGSAPKAPTMEQKTINIAVIGDKGSGKSSLIKRFENAKYQWKSNEYSITRGDTRVTYKHILDGKEITFNISDSEDMRTKADIFLVTCDLRTVGLNETNAILEEVNSKKKTSLLVGTFDDILRRNNISKAQPLIELAATYDTDCILSPTTNDGMSQILEQACTQLYDPFHPPITIDGSEKKDRTLCVELGLGVTGFILVSAGASLLLSMGVHLSGASSIAAIVMLCIGGPILLGLMCKKAFPHVTSLLKNMPFNPCCAGPRSNP